MSDDLHSTDKDLRYKETSRVKWMRSTMLFPSSISFMYPRLHLDILAFSPQSSPRLFPSTKWHAHKSPLVRCGQRCPRSIDFFISDQYMIKTRLSCLAFWIYGYDFILLYIHLLSLCAFVTNTVNIHAPCTDTVTYFDAPEQKWMLEWQRGNDDMVEKFEFKLWNNSTIWIPLEFHETVVE